jgi:hypothetical protein
LETIVHTPDGYTHGVWWQATSYAGIEKARLEPVKAASGATSLAAATARDYLWSVAGAASLACEATTVSSHQGGGQE